MRPLLRRLFPVLVASLASGAFPARAQEPAPAEAAKPVWTDEQRAAIELLRGLRRKDRPADKELASRLSEPGQRLLPLLFDVLVERQVPALAADDKPQVLSEVQENVILQALVYLDRDPVLALVNEALAVPPRDPKRRLAALGCIGAVAHSNDLLQLFEIALAADETKLDERLEAGLRRAVSGLLARDPLALEQLSTLRRITRSELLPTLIGAVGDAGSGRGLAYLSDVAYWHENLIVEIMSQVRRIGLSGDESVDDAMRVRLRPYLDESQPGPCRAAIPALVALADDDSIGQLITLLGSENAGLRENAHWALRTLTGLALALDRATWARWHQAELAWLVREKPRQFQHLRASDAAEVSAALRETLTHPLARRELVATLPELLKNRWPAIRVLACRTLAELRAKEAVPKLVWALEDRDPDVVQAAHAALKALTQLDLPKDALAWQSATHTEPRGTEL